MLPSGADASGGHWQLHAMELYTPTELPKDAPMHTQKELRKQIASHIIRGGLVGPTVPEAQRPHAQLMFCVHMCSNCGKDLTASGPNEKLLACTILLRQPNL